jgi:ferric-dicitrate binding protein FerR (iron transport regulator)
MPHWIEQEDIMTQDEAIEIILQTREGPAPGSAEHRELMAYLDKSPECRALYEQQQALWDELDVWQAIEPSAGFDAQLLAKIEAANRPWWRDLFTELRPGFAVVLATLLLVAGLVLRQEPAGPTEAAPKVAIAGPSDETQYYERLDSALDDLEMLVDFEALPLPAPGEGRS